MPTLDICFSPDLLPLYELEGKVVVIVDILRATSTIVTALGEGITHVFPVATLHECAALGHQHTCLTAAERDGPARPRLRPWQLPVQLPSAKAAPIPAAPSPSAPPTAPLPCTAPWPPSTSSSAPSSTSKPWAEFARRQQRDVLVVCAGWKGKFCLEDTVFGGALAARLQPRFDVTSSDATLAALHLYQQAQPDLPAYLLQSAHVRRLNSLEASHDFAFCTQIDTYAHILPIWQADRLVAAS
jgi:2-phosphosulfolactate phosphatase